MEVEEKLKVHLFPEFSEQTISRDPIEPIPIQQQEPLTSHQKTPLSVGIENYIDEKGSIRIRSINEVKHSLNHLIEEWGDIPIGSVTREMTTNFKGHVRKLPKNRKKFPQFRDKEFHELVGMNVKDTISTTTVNKHFTWCSSFYDWSINHGYSNINPFKG